MKILKVGIVLICLTSTNVVLAASFDCTKAKTKLEKLICSNPELNLADQKMGDIYKRISKSFPLKGFIQETQREFISRYDNCLRKSDRTAVENCLSSVKERISELVSAEKAQIYSDASEKFSAEDLAVLIYSQNGKSMIRLWGNWMPDAYDLKPFPNGIICNINAELAPAKGGFKTEETADTVFKISESTLNISEHIMCSPRTGISEGNYKRIK